MHDTTLDDDLAEKLNKKRWSSAHTAQKRKIRKKCEKTNCTKLKKWTKDEQ